jgi:endo-1,3-1,4-beta-glycanase ExoK
MGGAGGNPATVGGGSGTGGAAGASSGGAAGSSSGSFTLAWQDNFDTLDPTLWQLMTHSWDSNLALFSTQNTTVAGGILAIHLTPEASDTVKPFRGVELRSIRTITYGKLEARVRFARGSGVISGLVTIYTPWPADDWNEIDIEHLGKTADSVQLNCQVYEGPPTTPPVTQSVTPTRYEQITPLGFDAQAEFHTYSIEWTPTDVRFMADGVLLRTWSSQIARMKLPQNVLFTVWASSAASWAGPIQPDTAPTRAEIDWIKVYDWLPE